MTEHGGREGRGDQLDRGLGEEGVKIRGGGGELRRRRSDRSTVRTQAAVNMIGVEELVLWTVEQSREPAAVHRGHADDEELLGEEGVKVVGGDDVEVDGELGVWPGAELGSVQVGITGILGAGTEAGDDCTWVMLRSLCGYFFIVTYSRGCSPPPAGCPATRRSWRGRCRPGRGHRAPPGG